MIVLTRIVVLFLLILSAHGADEVTVPASNQVVVDHAGVVDVATAERTTALLLRLRELTTAEVKVLVVPTTDPEDIVGFSQRHYSLWKLGLAGSNNGALIVLAVNDHHVRIHTGYGLEPVLPDSWCGSLSREVASEQFKAGLYSQGLERMVRAVASEIANAQHVDLGQTNADRYVPPTTTGSWQSLVTFLILFVIFLVVVWRNRNTPSSRGWGASYGGFGGGGSNGSFGGGSSGGFSGGGGSSGGGGGGASW